MEKMRRRCREDAPRTLGRNTEFAGFFHITVGHARSIERSGRAALPVEKNQSAGSMRAMRELAHARIRDGLCQRERAGLLAMRQQHALIMQKIGSHFGHHNLHDAFAVAGAGNAASFRVSITTTANQRRIADAAGKFAARAAGRRSREEMPVLVERDCAHGAGFVAEMIFGGVRIAETTAPGDAFAFMNQIFGWTKFDAVLVGEFFRAAGDQHHVLTVFQDCARQADGIVNMFDCGDCAGFQRVAIHQDRVELHVAFAIQVRAISGVERGVVFQNHNSGFDGVNRGAAGGKNFPSGFERALDSGAAGFHRFVGDVPGAAVNDQGRFQGSREIVRKS